MKWELQTLALPSNLPLNLLVGMPGKTAMRRIFALILALLLFALCIATPAYSVTCAVGLAGVAPTASLSFPAVTVNTDGSPIATPVTYNLYQGTASGAEVKIASALVAGSANTIKTGLSANTTFYWYVTAVDSTSSEGAPSNEGCKIFAKVVPGTTTITVTMLDPVPRWFG